MGRQDREPMNVVFGLSKWRPFRKSFFRNAGEPSVNHRNYGEEAFQIVERRWKDNDLASKTPRSNRLGDFHRSSRSRRVSPPTFGGGVSRRSCETEGVTCLSGKPRQPHSSQPAVEPLPPKWEDREPMNVVFGPLKRCPFRKFRFLKIPVHRP